jgi:sulfur carrier protein
MDIYVNSKLQEIGTDASVSDALNSMNIPGQKGIAIAVNNNVIPKAEWGNYKLKEADKVTLIKATQGG